MRGAARLLHLGWDQAWHILDQAVARGLRRRASRRPTRIGIDEKAIARRQDYVTVVCDLDRATVEYIWDGRTQAALDGYFLGLSTVQRSAIEAVAVDMWAPYAQSVRDHVPGADAKIVFDRYHIMRRVLDAVDAVRRQELRSLRAAGDNTLAGTRQIWLYAAENVPPERRAALRALLARPLKTVRAWEIKEALRDLWTYTYRACASRHWKRWYYWATHSRLGPIVRAARTIARHLSGVLAYFGQPVTNAVSESLAARIETIRRRACGFRNREHLKTSIYFHCGGLDLSPSPT